MGGHALKRAHTRRYTRRELNDAWAKFSDMFRGRFPGVRVALVPSVADKTTFGDMDIVIDGEAMPDDWHTYVMELFLAIESNVYVKVESRPADGSAASKTAKKLLNRPFSFALDDLQVDILPVAADAYAFTVAYLSYGDLGALMGPVYRSLGARYGMGGLTVLPLDRQGNEMSRHPVLLTLNHAEALRFAGYCPDRYAQGFDTLEDVQRYVASSTFFAPSLYLKKKRENAKTRERDRKRPGHPAFAAWVKTHYQDITEEMPIARNEARRRLLTQFPHAEAACALVVEELLSAQQRRTRYSGAMLKDVTGLHGPSLGKFAEFARSDFASTHEFQAFLARHNDQQLRAWVGVKYREYKEGGVCTK